MNQTPRERLDAAAGTRIPADLNLYPRIAAQLERKTLMQTLRAKPALMILFVLLALALLSGVAYAIGLLTGFIPGFGFTSDASSVYTLAEPVEFTSNGISLRVLQATSDSQRFSITIEQTGQVETTSDFVEPFTAVFLPNGEEIEFQESTGNTSRDDNHRVITFEFSALPPETGEISLRYEILGRGGSALWQAELPLRLRPLRVDEIIPPPARSIWEPLASGNHGGLSIILENVASASDKTILQVALRFDQPQTSLLGDWNVNLTGADGTIYPLALVMRDSNDQIKTYETVPFTGSEALSLSLTAFPDPRTLTLSTYFWENAPAFTFDPGPNPQVGQTWQLDETLQAGEFTLRIAQAVLSASNALTFTLQPDSPVTGIMLHSEAASGAGGNFPAQNGVVSATLSFDTLPSKPFEIHLMRVNYPVQGEWSISWQAPAAPTGVKVGSPATPPPTPSIFIPPTPAFSNPLWLELVGLTESFDAPFQQGPGWIHYVTETEARASPGRTFPPPYIKSEQWLEIDEQGYVTRTLHTDYNEAGNILQQSVTIGDYFINFTLGESGYLSGKRHRFSSSFLLQDFNAALEYDDYTTVNIEEALCDNGDACYLIAFWETFGAPVQNSGETLAFSGSARQTWVDKATGQTLRTRTLWRFEDGTEQVDFSQTLLMLEKLPSPPQEILDLLAKLVLP